MQRSANESDRGMTPRVRGEGALDSDAVTLALHRATPLNDGSDLVPELDHVTREHHRHCLHSDAAGVEITRDTSQRSVRLPACRRPGGVATVPPPGSDLIFDRHTERGPCDMQARPSVLCHRLERQRPWVRSSRSDSGISQRDNTEHFSVEEIAEVAPVVSECKHNETLRHSHHLSADGDIEKCHIYSLSATDIGRQCLLTRKKEDKTADNVVEESRSEPELIDVRTFYFGDTNNTRLQPSLDFRISVDHTHFKNHLVRYGLKHLAVSLLRKSHELPGGTLKIARGSTFQTLTNIENTNAHEFHSSDSKRSAKPQNFRHRKTLDLSRRRKIFDFKSFSIRTKGIQSEQHLADNKPKADTSKPGQRDATDSVNLDKHSSHQLFNMAGLTDKEYLIHKPGEVSEETFNELSPLKTLLARPKSKAKSLYDSLNENREHKYGRPAEERTGENVAESRDRGDEISSTRVGAPRWQRLLDVALAYFWVGPLVTVYWCNTWHIPEHYLLPSDPEASSWICGAVGYAVYFLATFFQGALAEFAGRLRGWRRPMRWALMQLYSYVMCWACILQWRCVWVLLDVYTGASLLNAAVTCVGASAALLLMRVHRTTASAPSTVRMDLPVEGHFQMDTFFEMKTGHWLSRAADSICTVVVVDTVGITFWRGFWQILDFALVPEDKTMSAVWTLVISYSLALVLVITQDLVKRVTVKLEDRHWIVYLVAEDLMTLAHTVVTVCHWRGYWGLMDVYLPFKPLSHWVCHLVSFCLLAIGLTATSIPVLGCVWDGRIQKGEGIVFDNYYFTHLRKLWTLAKDSDKMKLTEEKQNADVMCTAVMTKT